MMSETVETNCHYAWIQNSASKMKYTDSCEEAYTIKLASEIVVLL